MARDTNTHSRAHELIHHADRADFQRGYFQRLIEPAVKPPIPSSSRGRGTAMNAFHAAGPLVEIENLSKHYGDFEAVSQFSLKVGAGELFALLGPNGAGKTTTIRMLMGILQPSTGAARIGVFYDYLRGGEIIRFIGEMHGFSKAEIARRTDGLLARLELKEAINEFAVNYSKGMKKKLALICAMLHDPALLILDEPTNGLDPFATRTLHEIMRERVAAGCTVFFSTHLLDQAEKLCSRMAIIHRGRLVAVGSLVDLRTDLPAESSLEEVFFALTGSAQEDGGVT
jgi:ABC-2 type transport system ATP-binding protein